MAASAETELKQQTKIIAYGVPGGLMDHVMYMNPCVHVSAAFGSEHNKGRRVS